MAARRRLALQLLLVFGAAAVPAGAAWFGRAVPFSEQWPMYEGLRTTSAIVFAVLGAWLAVIYPERLKGSFGRQLTTVPAAPAQLSQLMTPIAHSTLILATVLLVGVIAPLARHYLGAVDVQSLRGLAYGLLAMLTLWQLWVLVTTLVPANTIKLYLDGDEQVRGKAAAFKSLATGDPEPRKVA